MRESIPSEGCPSSFSRLHSFIFAFQTSLDTAIAARSFLVAFLLLSLLSDQGIERVEQLCGTFSLLEDN